MRIENTEDFETLENIALDHIKKITINNDRTKN